MASVEKARARSAKALKEKRAEHQRLAKKLNETTAKLEKRTHKLRALESEIAKLERSAHVPKGVRRNSKAVDKNLRPARLIYNPKSGANPKDGHSLKAIVALLRAHGIRASVAIKTSGKAARDAAKAAADKKEELVIAAGGDGTVEDVASQLVGSKTALGVLPVGTMNNVARSLGIPLDLNDACALLGAGSTRQVDVGHIIGNEKPDVEYFLETAGLGLTAIVFPASQAAGKGRLAGLPHALRRLFDYKPGPVSVELDGKTILADSQLVTVSNAPLMGLNFLIAPSAKMDDGLLDIAVYDGMGKTDLLEYFVSMRNGKAADNPKVKLYQARKVRIRCRSAQPVDSEKTALPDERVMDIELMPQALRMVVGKGIGLNSPVEAVQSVPPLSGPQPGASDADDSAEPKNRSGPQKRTRAGKRL